MCNLQCLCLVCTMGTLNSIVRRKTRSKDFKTSKFLLCCSQVSFLEQTFMHIDIETSTRSRKQETVCPTCVFRSIQAIDVEALCYGRIGKNKVDRLKSDSAQCIVRKTQILKWHSPAKDTQTHAYTWHLKYSKVWTKKFVVSDEINRPILVISKSNLLLCAHRAHHQVQHRQNTHTLTHALTSQ